MSSKTDQVDSALLASLLCGLFSLFVFAAVQVWSWNVLGGKFEYPLDDVYIHLAVAEQIVSGGYGINFGEPSSPASSPLYPLLLTPFAGTELQRLLPLVLNVIGAFGSAALFGRILSQGGLTLATSVALGALGVIVANMAGVAVTGMEHSLHMAASLAILSGLLSQLKSGKVSWLLVAGVFLAPAFRPEGLALSLFAAAIVFLQGNRIFGLGLVAFAVLAQTVFVAFLLGLGLEPVPSSIATKLGAGAESETFGNLLRNLDHVSGYALLLLAAVTLWVSFVARVAGPAEVFWVGLAASATGFAHLFAGQIGWLNRYEPYCIAVMLAGGIVASRHISMRIRRASALVVAPAVLFMGFWYGAVGLTLFPTNVLAVHLQQIQMGRLAKSHLKEPVAVNDIGYVAWANPSTVLDLWGLASAEARRLRVLAPEKGWAGPLVEERGVELIMIYENWLGDAVSPEWEFIGTLSIDLENPQSRDAGIGIRPLVIGSTSVNFYAPNSNSVSELEPVIASWIQDLPDGALFRFAAQEQQ